MLLGVYWELCNIYFTDSHLEHMRRCSQMTCRLPIIKSFCFKAVKRKKAVFLFLFKTLHRGVWVARSLGDCFQLRS